MQIQQNARQLLLIPRSLRLLLALSTARGRQVVFRRASEV